MALCEDIRKFTTRRRNLLYLMQRYLFDNGYYGSAEALKNEAHISEDYELCDNIDLDAMYLEFANYYNIKFGKYPKVLKKAKPVAKIEVAATSSNSTTSINPTTSSTSSPPSNTKVSTLNASETKKRKNSKSLEGKELKGQSEIGPLQITVTKLNTAQLHRNESEHLLPEIEHGYTTLSDDGLFNSMDWQQLVDLVKMTIMRDQLKLCWSDIYGNFEAIELVKEAVITPLLHPQYFSHDLSPWRSVLIHGPPGSGKTLLAKTLYAETQALGVTFFNISSSILISKWRGESEKLLRVLFHLAEKRAPSIIFLDEIEGLTSKRDRPSDHESSKRFKNELLQLLDGMEHQLRGVFILASTNMPWEIDNAFLRRFEKKLIVELPRQGDRKNLIWKLLSTSRLKPSEEQIEQLVNLSKDFTGDEIRLACKEIAMHNVRLLTNGRTQQPPFTDSAQFEYAFRQVKPLGMKLMAQHHAWHQEHGS